METQAVTSSAEMRKKDRDIRKLKGEMQKESDTLNNMIAKYQRELIDVQSVSDWNVVVSYKLYGGLL